MNSKTINREAREVRLRNAAAHLALQNHGLYRVSRKVRAFYRGESAVLPKPKHHLERALNPKINGADAIIDEFAEALKLYLPDEIPRQPLRVAYESTRKLIERGLESVHRDKCLNKMMTILSDMKLYFTHPKPDTTPEDYRFWVEHFRKLWKQGCYANSDVFYDYTTEALNRRENVATSVAAPTLSHSRKTRAANGALTQDDVAADFEVTRQTVLRWERGRKNPWGYYAELRLNPDLRGAYTLLVNSAKTYNRLKREAAVHNTRFRLSFVTFNEQYLKHNQARL